MLKNFFKIFIPLFIVGLILSACGQKKDGVCHLRDGRFACAGVLSADGNVDFSFSQVPQGSFELSSFSLDKVDSESGDAFYFKKCSLVKGNNKIEKDKSIYVKCPTLEKGIYYFKFSIKHYEKESYQPEKNENCILKKGGKTEWECKTGGEFKYEIK